MHHGHQILTLLLIALLLASCANSPSFPIIENQPTPKAAVHHSASKQPIVWGGVIINATNLAATTRLEVLAYPLDRHHRPKSSKNAQGRFFIEKEGYLETADYAPKRKITVHGQIISIEKGKVGEADYDFPLIKATTIHLWPKPSQQNNSSSRVHFGFGVNVSN
jgi:outer membrane lipoprotein